MQSISDGSDPQVTAWTCGSPAWTGHTWGCSLGQAWGASLFCVPLFLVQAAPQILCANSSSAPGVLLELTCPDSSEHRAGMLSEKLQPLNNLKPRNICGGPHGCERWDETCSVSGRLAVERGVEAAVSPGWEHWELRLVSQAGSPVGPQH